MSWVNVHILPFLYDDLGSDVKSKAFDTPYNFHCDLLLQSSTIVSINDSDGPEPQQSTNPSII